MKKYLTTFASILLPLIVSAQVITFHNIPYATAERWQEPVMVEGWDKTADYSARGPMCPQTLQSESKDENMYLADNLPQVENNLTVTIHTKDMAGKAPVAVYVHGGSHHHGSGEWVLYDASGLTEQEGLVTVNISFRHGVFGYLYDEKTGDANLGTRDIITALRWINENIADFGGDPDNITVFGQSSGAQSVAIILTTLDEKLFKRAAVLSAPLGLPQSHKRAAEKTQAFYDALAQMGIDPMQATSAQLIEGEEMVSGMLPFAPSIDGKKLPKEVKCGVEDVLVTWQADDASMFVQDFRKESIQEYGGFLDNILSKVATAYVFSSGSKKFAKQLKHQGVNVTKAKFTYKPKDGHLKAAHGVEMALLYGPAECYVGYTILGSVTAEELEAMRVDFRHDFARFCKEGVWESKFSK